jgi:hypothetical protein
MAKTNNISTDNYQIYLIELMVANQKKILNEFDLLKKRLDKVEECMCMEKMNENKPSQGYNTKEVLEIVPICRNTLLNYRKEGIISGKRKGRKLIYSAEDIEILKKQL